MYFLDTNALYFYIGREQLGEHSDANVNCELLRLFLDNRTDKALASSAYIEALVKFRDKPEYAEKLHSFIFEKNLHIYNNVQYLGFSTEHIMINSNLKGAQLSNYIKSKVLPNKINVEVRFATAFLMSIVLLYTKYLIDGSSILIQDYDIGLFIRDKLLKKVQLELLNALSAAYDNNENYEQQIFKNKYIELLEEGCRMADTIVELLSDEKITIEKFEIINNEIDEKYEQLKNNNPNNYMMEKISELLNTRPQYKEYAKKRFADMYSKKGKAFKGKEKYAFIPMQTDYLSEEMYSSWLDKSQKFRKNDIFDFFFLGCSQYIDDRTVENKLVDRSTYLLTFDKKLDRYIEKKRPANGREIRRFYSDF